MFLAILLFLPARALAAGNANASDHWLAPVFFGVFAALSFRRLWRNFRCARAIEDTPTGKVATAAQGEVELCGRARVLEKEPVVCPLTGSACLWYSFKVERYERRGKNSRWVTISIGRSVQPFALEDETGRALVVPMGAEVTPTHRRQWRGSSATPSPPYGESRFFFAGSYRYTEEFILPDDQVYVLGFFETVQGGQAPAGALSEKLREMKQNRAALLERFDRDKDGEISLEEWDAARAAAEEAIRREALQAPPTAPCHTVTQPAQSDLPFLISAVPQSELAGRYRRRAAFSLAGFLGFGAAAVWFFTLLLKGV
jgi:hypothetical protein